jgi:superfamily II DNA or RNA helicase
MTRWTRRIQIDVEIPDRNKGHNHFRSGAVKIKSGGPGKVTASVNGSGEHFVEIKVDRDAVVAFCTCRSFGNGKFCEHIWGTLLSAESHGHLRRIASMWEPYLEHGLEYVEEGPDNVEDAIDEDGPDSTAYDFTESEPESPVRSTARRVSRPAPKVPAWKERISALRQATNARYQTANAESRRVLYFVDISECLSAGTFIVQSVVCRMKKTGEWGKPNFQESVIRDIDQFGPADVQLLSLLSPSSVSYGYSSPHGGSVGTRHRLPQPTLDIVMPLLCATGRFFMRTVHEPDDFKPLEWDSGIPYAFGMNVERDPVSNDYVITALMKRNGEERDLAEPQLLVPGLAFFENRIARFDDAGAFQWVSFFRKNGQLPIPAEQRKDFIAEIAKFRELPPLEFPDELRIEPGAFAGPPQLRIRATQDKWNFHPKLECEITFDYGVKISAAETAIAVHEPVRDLFLSRDRAAESKALQRLADLGVRRVDSWNQPEKGWELAPARLPSLVHTLVSEGWRVEAEGKLYRRPGAFKIDVTSGIDWFEVHGAADFEGHRVELPELLKAVKRGDNMVRLGDGSYGLLPEEWLSRYRFVGGLGKEDGGQIRFTRGQAGLLDALLASQPEVTFDEGFLRVRRELASFAGVDALDPSPTFKGRLRDYQKEGLGWLRFLRRFGFGGCLADDMGLGKTVQVLALLDSDERKGAALIVAPRSLVFNWKQEAARFAPRLRVLDFSGVARRDRWNDMQEHDIVLTTYGTMRRDAPQLKDIHFDTIVLDEAQAIKNASSESAKAARLLRASHRLALTGTPIENHLGDLWSLLEFLNPGLLGTATVFGMETTGNRSAETAAVLSKALRPFILRRTKDQVARELPPKLEQTIYCELKADQKKLYNELRDHYRDALLGRIDDLGIQKSRMQILEALLRLRQAACHPGLVDKSRTQAGSAKLDALIPQIKEVVEEGHKALVFSQFTSFLTIVRKRLDQEKIPYLYLDGQTRDRESLVRKFQDDPQFPLFLISLKAGGLGLNLTAAEYVFLLDPWWNPAVEAQAIDRTHRIGQSRHVFAYRLISKDTVEEKVLELQKSKRDLADAIITADNSVLKGLDRKTLELLLS